MEADALIKVPYTPVEIAAADFDHPAWGAADPVSIVHYWSGERAPTSRHAEARIVWSDGALCVRFVCQQREPLVVSPNPQTDSKTLGLWDRDVCEIFIAPNPEEPGRYFEFEAAPTGEWVDLAIRKDPEGRETDFDFHSGMTTAAHCGEDKIFVAMRVPWSEHIRRPQPGELWRANLFRCVGRNPDRGYLAWRATHTEEPSFHSPESFGWLLFGE